jgi:2-polyprenyl-6-methoxyphenol hydroxylase-like FAD-dependent oxidoreductase
LTLEVAKAVREVWAEELPLFVRLSATDWEEGGDILIGADGGGSTVRSLVLPDIGPTYSGYVVWPGLVNEADLPLEAKEKTY